jgi:hypothetical protein
MTISEQSAAIIDPARFEELTRRVLALENEIKRINERENRDHAVRTALAALNDPEKAIPVLPAGQKSVRDQQDEQAFRDWADQAAGDAQFCRERCMSPGLCRCAAGLIEWAKRQKKEENGQSTTSRTAGQVSQ